MCDSTNEDLLGMSKKELLIEIVSTLRTIANILKKGTEVKKGTEIPTKIVNNVNNEEEEEDFEIVEGTKIPGKTWAKAKRELTTGERLTKFLLPLVFTKQELATSNYRGGGCEKKNPLDEEKICAIQDAVLSLFPDFSQTQFGAAVNSKCVQTKLKSSNNKQPKENNEIEGGEVQVPVVREKKDKQSDMDKGKKGSDEIIKKKTNAAGSRRNEEKNLSLNELEEEIGMDEEGDEEKKNSGEEMDNRESVIGKSSRDERDNNRRGRNQSFGKRNEDKKKNNKDGKAKRKPLEKSEENQGKKMCLRGDQRSRQGAKQRK